MATQYEMSTEAPATRRSVRASSRVSATRLNHDVAIAAAAMGLLLGTAASQASPFGVACTPQVSVTEQAVGGAGGVLLGQYVMQTGNLCGTEIVALAVDNNESLAAYANLSGWNSQVVTNEYWDAGIVLSRDDFGTGSSYVITTGPAGVGSFTSFFGPFAEKANLYWLSAHYGGPVLDNSIALTAVGDPVPIPDDAFQFETRAMASTAIAFTNGGGVVFASNVPEPSQAVLLALGCLGVLATTRWRRQVPALA